MLTAFQKIGKNIRGRLELLTSIYVTNVNTVTFYICLCFERITWRKTNAATAKAYVEFESHDNVVSTCIAIIHATPICKVQVSHELAQYVNGYMDVFACWVILHAFFCLVFTPQNGRLSQKQSFRDTNRAPNSFDPG